MTSSYLTNPIVFLVTTLFGLYIGAIMLRFMLQTVRADFYNPVSQFLVKITNPPLVPLRRIIPSFRGIDTASWVLMLALQMLEIVIIGALFPQVMPSGIGLLTQSIAQLLELVFTIYFFTILIQVVISWVNPGLYNPVTELLHQINEPLLGRARRLIPPISGFDLSPIVVIIGLQLLKMLILPLILTIR